MKTIHLSPVVERIIVIVAIALVGVSFFGYLVTEQRGWNNYSTSYQETISSNASSTQSLLSVIDELKVDLDVAQKTIEDNEDEIDRLDGKVDDLTTIVKTDPELLQKYSKVFFLSENYKPTSIKEVDAELVFPKEKTVLFHGKVMNHLEDLLEDAADDDIELFATSGYRSFEEQIKIKSAYATTYGTGANAFSADQGYSEHQLGTAVDFLTSYTGLTTAFENTQAFEWLQKNAYKYGFVLSYPKGNAYYVYEPWHWRYVGKRLATKLYRDEETFYSLDQRTLDKYILYFFD